MSSDSKAHIDLGDKGVIVAGAGLAGSLLAIYLRKMGYEVNVYEKRGDMRRADYVGGRSINLILTSRGINALNEVGIADRISKITTPVIGRMLHDVEGKQSLQRYGPDDTYCNYSVSRSELNIELMNVAEDMGANFFFNQGVDHVDIPNTTLYTHVEGKGHPYLKAIKSRHIFGSDGGGSRCRQALKHLLGAVGMNDKGVPLGASYKELTMPAASDGSYVMDKTCLHLWPRGSHFLMGLPNQDGSFTMTLYMNDVGENSFGEIRNRADLMTYFQTYYKDAIPFMPDLVEEYFANPVGFLGTVYCDPAYYQDKLLLVGDAMHAIVPFFGQGCNAAFEGVNRLCHSMTIHKNRSRAFLEHFHSFKPDADAIAQMAIENYYEMMAKVRDPKFLLEKEIEIKLHQHWSIFESRYAMVTHTLIPYSLCVSIGKILQSILSELSKDITSVDQLDMKKAGRLIESKLLPYLSRHSIDQDTYKDPSFDIMQGNAKPPPKFMHKYRSSRSRL